MRTSVRVAGAHVWRAARVGGGVMGSGVRLGAMGVAEDANEGGFPRGRLEGTATVTAPSSGPVLGPRGGHRGHV